jgi:hypothetical protein
VQDRTWGGPCHARAGGLARRRVRAYVPCVSVDVLPAPSVRTRVLPRLGPMPVGWPWIVVVAVLGSWIAGYPASADPFGRVPGAGPQADIAHHAVLSLARDGWPATLHTRAVGFPTIQNLHADSGAPFAGLALAGAVRLLGASGGLTFGLLALVALSATGVGVLAARWWRSSVAGVTAAWVVVTSGPVSAALSTGAADGLLALAVAPLAMACAMTALRVDRGRWGAATGVCLAFALGAGVVHATWVGFGLAGLVAAAVLEGLAEGGWTRGAAVRAGGRVVRFVGWSALALVVLAWGPWLALHAHIGVSPEAVGVSSFRPSPPGTPYRWFAVTLGTAGHAADALLAAFSVRPMFVALAALALRGGPARRVIVPLGWLVVGWTLALGPAAEGTVVYADPRGYTLLSVLGGAVLAGGGAARAHGWLRTWRDHPVAPRLAWAAVPCLLALLWADARPWRGGIPVRPGTPGPVARAAAAAAGPVLVLPLRTPGDARAQGAWPTDQVLDQAFHGRPTPIAPAEPGRAGAWPHYDDSWGGGLMRALAECEGREDEVVVDAELVDARDVMARSGLREVLVDPERVGGGEAADAWRACIARILGEPVGTRGPLQVYRLPEPAG